jgi:hypothetical protein
MLYVPSPNYLPVCSGHADFIREVLCCMNVPRACARRM